eukprot:2668627-Pyramimonas_sp.AAC.1
MGELLGALAFSTKHLDSVRVPEPRVDGCLLGRPRRPGSAGGAHGGRRASRRAGLAVALLVGRVAPLVVEQ